MTTKRHPKNLPPPPTGPGDASLEGARHPDPEVAEAAEAPPPPPAPEAAAPAPSEPAAEPPAEVAEPPLAQVIPIRAEAPAAIPMTLLEVERQIVTNKHAAVQSATAELGAVYRRMTQLKAQYAEQQARLKAQYTTEQAKLDARAHELLEAASAAERDRDSVIQQAARLRGHDPEGQASATGHWDFSLEQMAFTIRV